MPFIEEAVEKFKFELPEEVQLTCDTPEVVASLKLIEQAYDLELSPVIIYFVVGDLSLEEIPDYLENEYYLDEITAKKLADELKEKILNPLLERVDFLNEHPDKDMTLEQEKIYVENIFKKKFLAELGYDAIIKAAVNRRLFFILARDLEFRKTLEQAMYNNEEVLSSQPLIIDGQKKQGTISNWLRDYVSHYGGQDHNSVNMSAFIINSENSKVLSVEERSKLTDVLKTYINLKFFPDSMPSDDGDDWQIIPYEVEEKPIPSSMSNNKERIETLAPAVPKKRTEFKKTLTPTRLIVNKDLAAPTPPIKQETTVVTPTPASHAPTPKQTIKPTPGLTETGAEADLAELKAMLLQYPEGSLERAAIEEEIKTLQKK